jgi:hypothetical protein
LPVLPNEHGGAPTEQIPNTDSLCRQNQYPSKAKWKKLRNMKTQTKGDKLNNRMNVMWKIHSTFLQQLIFPF